MKCPECVKLRLRSKVVVGYQTRTLMIPSPDWYDEDGNHHNGDDPNTTTTNYSCSNGHGWTDTAGSGRGELLSVIRILRTRG